MNVELGAIDVGLRKTLDASAAKLRAWGQSLVNVGKQMAAIGAAATAAFGAAGVAFAGAGGELERMSRRLGISAEMLQGLGYAADQTGADLGAVVSALDHVGNKLYDFAMGSVEAEASFRLLGLSGRHLGQLGKVGAFREIGEKIKGLGNETIRSRQLMEQFGDVRLAGLFEPGAAGIDEFVQKAEALGVVMSGDTVKGAHDLEQALKGLRMQGSAVTNAIGAAVAPAMQLLAEAMGPVIKATVVWIRENRETVIVCAAVAGAIAGVGLALVGLGLALKLAGVALGTLGLAFNALKVVKLVNIALLGVWKLAVLAWSAAVLVAKGAVLSFSLASIIAKAAVAAWTVAMTGLQAAALAVQTALSALSLVTVIANVAALGAALFIVVNLFSALAVAIGAAWQIGKGLFGLLAAQARSTTGPIGALKGVFAEWKGVIGDVILLLREDLPAALKLMRAAGGLAVAQFKALWPPLWEFIKGGFQILADAIGSMMKATLAEVKYYLKFGVADIITGQGETVSKAAELERKQALEKASRRLAELASKFEVPTDTEELKEARAALEKARPGGLKGAGLRRGPTDALRQALQQVDVQGTFVAGVAGRLGGTTVNMLLKQAVDLLGAIAGNTEKPPPVFGAD